MSIGRSALLVLLGFAVVLFDGCASLQRREPIEVIMVGVEPLQGEGLELRMLVKLPGGSVPRFGEAIVDVPVSVSVFRIARQAVGVMTNEYRGKLTYEMNGKLAGPMFNSVHFKSSGEFALPAEITESGK